MNYHLSMINYHLSIINYQLSVITYQLLIINDQLSLINDHLLDQEYVQNFQKTGSAPAASEITDCQKSKIHFSAFYCRVNFHRFGDYLGGGYVL